MLYYRNHEGETSTDGIDTMDMCQINVEDAKSWQIHQPATNAETSQPTGVLGEGSGGGGIDGKGH